MRAAVQKAISVVEVEDVPEPVTQLDEINQAFDDQIHGKVMKALVKP